MNIYLARIVGRIVRRSALAMALDHRAVGLFRNRFMEANMGPIRFSKLAIALFAPLAMAAIAAAISSTPAKATTYDVNLTFGPVTVGGPASIDTLQGTITTDGKIGVLANSDITGFNLTMSAGGNSAVLNSAAGAAIGMGGIDQLLTATTSSLTFLGSSAQNGDFVQVAAPSLGSPTALVTFSTLGVLPVVLFSLNNSQINDLFQLGGDLQIGSVSATPIPNSLSLLAPVLGLIALLWWRDKRKSVLALRTA